MPVRLYLGIVIARRRIPSAGRLQMLVRPKQVVHQLDGMRRKRIHFVPRKSAVVSKGCDMIERFSHVPSAASETSLSLENKCYVQCDLSLKHGQFPLSLQLAAIWRRESQPS